MRKDFFRKRTVWLAAGALLLLGSAGAGQAMAYFTTYVTAAGGHPVALGYETRIEEEVENMTKHIVIANTGESDCYVRVRVFSGSQFHVSMTPGDGWSDGGDGFWYYDGILPVGEKTSELLAAIEDIPEDYEETFNIIVVQECTPVLYGEDGQPYADWDRKADTTTDIGTAGGEE